MTEFIYHFFGFCGETHISILYLSILFLLPFLLSLNLLKRILLYPIKLIYKLIRKKRPSVWDIDEEDF